MSSTSHVTRAPFIVQADDGADRSLVGGKASCLASARTAGIAVPEWFVVTADAFDASVTPEQLRALVAATRRAEPPDAGGIAPSAEVRTAVDRALAMLCPDNQSVALRSSAIAEDGEASSLAGQLESRLFVTPSSVCDALAAIWISGFSRRVLAYRALRGLEGAPSAPAVIVQRMVRADCSGIAFSADPVSGRRAIAVVAAVRGSGAPLASGLLEGDTWRVDRSGAVTSTHVGETPASCTFAQVAAAAALARAAAAHFGCPQDIEWALEGDRLWLLQSRPITALASLRDPDGVRRTWDNSNIVESYSGVTTPLTFSFASDVYEHVYRQFCRLVRVPERALATQDDSFRNMLGLIRGRMYYNLASWYGVLSLLPGFSINRRFMEQMMGVGDSLPPAIVPAAPRGVRGAVASVRRAGSLIATLASLVGRYLTIDRTIGRFRGRLDAALAPPAPDLADMRPDELVAHYRDLRRRLLLSWDAPILNDFYAMVLHGALRHALREWCGDVDGRLLSRLLGGQAGIVSAEPAVRLQRLAAAAKTIPAFVDLLESGSAPAIAAGIRRHAGFDREYRAYLERFGDRTVNELKLETRTLHDDPLPLLRAIARVARQRPAWRGASPADGGRPAAEAATVIPAPFFRRLPVRWLAQRAKARIRDREMLRLDRTRLFARVRAIFVELGRRLHDVGALRHPRDIFYLTVEEVIGFVEGRAVCTSLDSVVERRRQEFDEYALTPSPPPRFETRGPVYHANDFHADSPVETSGADVRAGIGCCAGIARGPVRIVTDPSAVDLSTPSVLVARHTDPGWVLLFPAALAVIVERGSLLSHAAIVARELEVPTVVSVPGVMDWLRSGDVVEIDGSSGLIRRLAATSMPEVMAAGGCHG